MTRALSAGILLGFAVGWNIANTGAVAEDLADAYGVGLTVVGLFTTALFVVHGLLQIPGGRAADRFGARRAGLLALGLLIVSNAILLVEPSPWLALVGRAAAGLGTGFGFVAGVDYVRAAGGSPLAQGLYGGAGVAGAGAALAVVPLVENAAEWRAPYLSALVLAAAVAVVLALAPADPPHERRGTTGGGVLKDTRLYPLAAIHASSFGLSIVVGNWVVTLLERGGTSNDTAGLVGALTLATGIVTRPLGGWIDREHRERVRFAVAASLVACGGATLLLAARPPLVVGALAAAIVGLAAGIPFAPAIVRAQALRPDAPAAATGFVNLCAVVVILTATPLLGAAFSLPDDGRIGFAVIGIFWALSALAARRL